MAKKAAPADPDKLTRQEAGTYRTADGRFEVREGATGWFLVDSAQTNEFGQELMRGPFDTLKAARAALPEARGAKPKLRVVPKPAKGGKARVKATAKEEPEPPAPKSWIDELPASEASQVRRLIAALESEGIADPEKLVRRDRDGLSPAIAETLIRRRLDALVDELPEKGREGARLLIDRAVAVLTAPGASLRDPLPRWSVVEVGPRPEPPNRRISLGD